ncbi:S8 family serine peptidase [Membranicola marinus]|uniref:S8 family serine peptidase n=1 Tax=Membranihabitans marinus TaxID=1227546 RepID=A0A953HKC6_9BACT|nr:S8 family serine peptidase [Membranihabitans marinus]MBY5957489.1 S8 family serine peptidase [Membranihabitans marinus]
MIYSFKTIISTILFFLSIVIISNAQNEGWLLLGTDSTNGANVTPIYENNLIKSPDNKIIVAVIDGGVEPDHEDLKSVMWVNQGEIAGNSQDDDHNGYADDIYGWNFIGGPDGRNVDQDTYEITRQYKRLHQKYADVDPLKLKKKEKKEYAKYLTYKKKVEEEMEKAKNQYEEIEQQKVFINNFLAMTQTVVGEKREISTATIDEMKKEKNNEHTQVLAVLENILENTGQSFSNYEAFESFIMDDIEKGEKHFESKFKYGYNPDFDPRSIVQDNYENKTQRYYGNADVAGPDAFHGTFVAGIIGADRHNNIGMKGISDQVEIMGVRVVPDGDERDKDVANGIIYAVDNGAKVINMSFGKGISPDKRIVDKAVRYAEKKDVLLVHAAGNSSEDIDVEENYPTALYAKRGFFGGKKYAKGWIEVGALGRLSDQNSVASFSNYGQKSVDIFAPGHQVYSATPGDGYKFASGTSFAAPVVAGVAAIIRANFPSLSAQEVKEILMESGDEITEPVIKPGTDEEVDFKTLSVSGKRINAFKAYQLAARRAS